MISNLLTGSSEVPSPKPGCFPAGLRVLVVDDDNASLKILEKMLKKCNYEVRTCNLAKEAVDMLAEKKREGLGFDMVISDVNMRDMDGFKFLEHVCVNMDVPVIMMSVNGETCNVMKGLQHGACDHLLKPIRMKELRNIWQHVFRKRMTRDVEVGEIQNQMEQSDDDGKKIAGMKRSRNEFEYDGDCGGGGSSVKKARVVWTLDLHHKFVKAVDRIGYDKVGPKKILDLMGVSCLTRENVASHLQKYRLYQSRSQKKKEVKAAAASSSGGITTSVCLQSAVSHNAVAVQQNIGPINENCGLNQSFELLNSQLPQPESEMQAYNYTWSAATDPSSVHFQTEHGRLEQFPHLTNYHVCDPCMWSTTTQDNPSTSSLRMGTEVELTSSPGVFYPLNPHNKMESFCYSNQDLVADVLSHSYDSDTFDCEYNRSDHVINQCQYFS